MENTDQPLITSLATTARAATLLLDHALSGDLDLMEPDERAALTGDLHAASLALDSGPSDPAAP
jgi:hypothetical protein